MLDTVEIDEQTKKIFYDFLEESKIFELYGKFSYYITINN